jgi:inhibitor of KinA sporulation pathway (predicted exonuclease)
MVEMLKSCGLKLIGNHHSGLDDAKNTARCAIEILKTGFKFT